MLQAMNTGHDGSMSTGHGNSPSDMMTRLETMVLMGIDMPLAAIKSTDCNSNRYSYSFRKNERQNKKSIGN